jgi:phosphoribosyl 1,2-cyclic phosphodiesterase
MTRLVYLLDDDPVAADLCATILRSVGCQTVIYQDVDALLRASETHPPDIIFLDERTRGVNGLDLSRRIRGELKLFSVKLVVMESHSNGKPSASQVVADARLEKPLAHSQVITLLSHLEQGTLELRFWGVRGSIAAPGPAHDRYGGNTSCVTLRLAMDEYIIFDAGTGIREFGNFLVRLGLPVRLHLLISHAHWDHIQGLPFFRPAYLPQNTMTIYGPNQPDTKFEQVIADQMQTVYFPVPISAMQAQLHFQTLGEGSYEVGGHPVRTMPLHHPGNTLGYRVGVRGKSFVYACDHEITANDPSSRKSLAEFGHDAHIMVADAQYVPGDFPGKLGWGHSSYTDVVDTALEAQVKHLMLTHHDPDRNDDALDAIVEDARRRIAAKGSDMDCSAAAEGKVMYL